MVQDRLEEGSFHNVPMVGGGSAEVAANVFVVVDLIVHEEQKIITTLAICNEDLGLLLRNLN